MTSELVSIGKDLYLCAIFSLFMYLKKRKGISPVIATVILIAVAVAIAIAVAFWAAGLTSTFTKYEKLGINSAYDNSPDGSPGTMIVLNLQNTGSSDASITDIFINGKPLSAYPTVGVTVAVGTTAAAAQNPELTPITVKTGQTATITIDCSAAGAALTSGVTYQFTVHTAAGNDYPKAVVVA